jgi:hypothetical protein
VLAWPRPKRSRQVRVERNGEPSASLVLMSKANGREPCSTR